MQLNDFDIRETRRADSVRVAVSGELDLETGPALAARLRQIRAERKAIQLDLSRLEFIDCAGIRSLLQAAKDARESGSPLEVVEQPNFRVRHVLALAHAQRLLFA
jgi:anti-sigma B factor antagonist